MKKLLIVFLLLLSPAALRAQSQSSQPKPLVFTHVTIIDVTGRPAQRDMTVVIIGDRIAQIGKTGKIRVPNQAQVIDAAGKFLIPGLWDMHVHTALPNFLPLYVANGVTGVRDVGNNPEFINKLRKETADGNLLGPRIVAAGPIIDGPKPSFPNISIAVKNEAEARKAVVDIKGRGEDFLKILSLLPREAYFAIADESKRQRIPFAGHVPISVTLMEASNAGQKSVEHLTGVLVSCSTQERELRKEMGEAMAKSDPRAVMAVMLGQSKTIQETYSEQKAAALFALLAKNRTWQVPTLTVVRAITSLKDASFTNDPRLKYMPMPIKQSWDPKKDFRVKDWTEENWAVQRRGFQKAVETVGAMHRAGVPIMAGTDTPNPYVFPGFSLHDELALLVKAGLTPMEALASATVNPARFFGMEKNLGTVKESKVADLVLLEANPLVDIHNTEKINAVVVKGRLLDRKELDGLLAKAETAANKP
jgi:imidazolonepropionase-like amidohydrolase